MKLIPVGEIENVWLRRSLTVGAAVIFIIAVPFIFGISAVLAFADVWLDDVWPEFKGLMREFVDTVESSWKGDFLVDKTKKSV